MLEDGPYAGDFALVIRPSKPFPFLRLPKHIRTKIYHHVLFPEDEDDKHKIVISSRAANKGGGVMAKSYIGQTKNRLSLLHVNKEVRLSLLFYLTMAQKPDTKSDHCRSTPSSLQFQFQVRQHQQPAHFSDQCGRAHPQPHEFDRDCPIPEVCRQTSIRHALRVQEPHASAHRNRRRSQDHPIQGCNRLLCRRRPLPRNNGQLSRP